MKTINTQNISEATETEEHVSKPVILLKKATTTEEIINTAKENIKIAVNFVKNGATREELIALLNTTTKNILNSMSCELGEGCFHYGVNTPKKTMVNFLADTIIQKTKNIYAETKTADTVTCAVETQQQKTKKKVKNFYLIYFEDAVSLNNCVVFRGTYSDARSYAFYYKRAWQKTEKIKKIERAKNFRTGEFLTSDKYTLEDVAAMLENASIDKNGKPILSEDFIFPSQVKTPEQPTPVEEIKQPEQEVKPAFVEEIAHPELVTRFEVGKKYYYTYGLNKWEYPNPKYNTSTMYFSCYKVLSKTENAITVKMIEHGELTQKYKEAWKINPLAFRTITWDKSRTYELRIGGCRYSKNDTECLTTWDAQIINAFDCSEERFNALIASQPEDITPEWKIKPVEKNKTPKADGQQLLIDFSDSQEIIRSKARTKRTRIKHDYSNQLLINFDVAA